MAFRFGTQASQPQTSLDLKKRQELARKNLGIAATPAQSLSGGFGAQPKAPIESTPSNPTTQKLPTLGTKQVRTTEQPKPKAQSSENEWSPEAELSGDYRIEPGLIPGGYSVSTKKSREQGISGELGLDKPLVDLAPGTEKLIQKSKEYFEGDTSTSEAAMYGTGRAISKTISGFTTPKNLALLGAMAFPPTRMAATAGMIPSMIEGTYESGKAAKEQFEKAQKEGWTPENTENFAEATAGSAISAGFTFGLGKSALRHAGLGASKIKPTTEIPQPQAESFAPPERRVGKIEEIDQIRYNIFDEYQQARKYLDKEYHTGRISKENYDAFLTQNLSQRSDVYQPGFSGNDRRLQEKIPAPRSEQSPVSSLLEKIKSEKGAVEVPEIISRIKDTKKPTSIRDAGREIGLDEKTLDQIAIGDTGGKKPRGFIKTIQESPQYPEMAKRVQGSYDPITNEATMSRARQIIDANEADARRIALSDETGTEANAIRLAFIDRLNKAGDIHGAVEIAERAAEAGTKAGQSVQIFSAYNRLTPEGVQILARKQIAKARAAVNPEMAKRVSATAENIANRLNAETEPAIEKVGAELVRATATPKEEVFDPSLRTESILKAAASKKPSKAPVTPEELLAEKVRRAVDPVEKKASDPEVVAIREMVKSLYDYARETLPEKERLKAPTRIDLIRRAMTERDKFRDTYMKAADIVREKLADNPEALKALDKYFGVGPHLPVPERLLSSAVTEQIRTSKVDLSKLIREHYKTVEYTKKSLADTLTERIGLKGDQAAELEGFINNRLSEILAERKQSALNEIFKQRKGKAPKGVDRRIIELSNLGAFSSRAYADLVAEKFGLPTLKPEVAVELNRLSNAIQETPPGRRRDVLTGLLLKKVADQVPASLGQKAATGQAMAQLLNMKTAIRNVLGNALFGAIENVSDIASLPADFAARLVTGERTKAFPRIGAQAKGFVSGLKEGTEDALLGINTSRNLSSQFDLPTGEVFKSAPMRVAQRMLNLELQAPDRAFYRAAYEGSLRQQMAIKRAPEPTPEMMETAHGDALYRTFQNEGVATTIFKGIKRALNAGKEFGIGDFVLKYPKTPANILSAGIEYSPAGFLNMAYQAVRPFFGKPFNQKAFAESFGRAATGTVGLIGAGALLHRMGVLTGRPNDDRDVGEVSKTAGIRPYQINFSGLKRLVLGGFDPSLAAHQEGDVLVNYDWMQPMAIPVAMGANIDETGGFDGIGLAGAVAEGVSKGVSTISEQPLVSGITRLFSSRDPFEGLTATLEAAPSSFVPSILSQIRMLTDQPRETYSPDYFERMKNATMARIPGLSQRLPPRLDVWGEEEKFFPDEETSFARKMFDVFLNPAWVASYKPTPESELVLDLYRQTGETKQAPHKVKKQQSQGGISIRLTTEQYQSLQKYAGAMTSERFRQLATDPKFLSLSAEDQVKKLSGELTKIGKISKLRVLGSEFEKGATDNLSRLLLHQDMERLKTYTDAEMEFEKLKDLAATDKDKANALAAQINDRDPALFKKVKELAAANKKGLTAEDRKIQQLGVENGFRAQYFWDQMKGMGSAEEKNAYLSELAEKGLASKKVLKQLQNLKAGKPFDAR